MKKTIIILLLFQLIFAAKAQYQTHTAEPGADTYLNPIFAGDYPDPSILRDGDNYYIVFYFWGRIAEIYSASTRRKFTKTILKCKSYNSGSTVLVCLQSDDGSR